jgi:carbon monoxide dehydrogenase subunit G
MKLSGSALLNAPAEQIFNSMHDPAFLVRTIPGCQQLEVVGPDEYQMTVNAGVASIKGTYLGNVRMVDPVPPQAYTLRASAQSAVGTVDADARISLEDRGGSTELRYDADARIGGTIAGVGQRVLTGVAKKMAGDFFAAVDRELTSAETGLAPSGVVAGEPTVMAAPNISMPVAVAPAASAPAGAAAGEGVATGEGAAVAARATAPRVGEVFRRPAPPPQEPAAAWWAGLAGAALGAAIALIGVALGARAARRG